MTVEEIRQWVNYRLNKSQTGNTLNKDEFNLCLSFANAEYFKLKYGLPEEYMPGKPLPRQAWPVSQENIDALTPFLKSRGGRDYPQIQVDVDGYASYPSDYVHVSALRYGDKPIEVVSNDVFGQRLSSSIVYPDKKYPICAFFDNYIQFAPKDLAYIKMDYFRFPETPFWNCVILNDEEVYTPNGSVQLEWPEQTHVDIANLCLQYASTNLRDFQMNQVAQQRKNEGQ